MIGGFIVSLHVPFDSYPLLGTAMIGGFIVSLHVPFDSYPLRYCYDWWFSC